VADSINHSKAKAIESALATTQPKGAAIPIRHPVHLLLGPMFSGKTTALKAAYVEKSRQAGRPPVLVKSSRDTRYDHHMVIPHGQGKSGGVVAD